VHEQGIVLRHREQPPEDKPVCALAAFLGCSMRSGVNVEEIGAKGVDGADDIHPLTAAHFFVRERFAIVSIGSRHPQSSAQRKEHVEDVRDRFQLLTIARRGQFEFVNPCSTPIHQSLTRMRMHVARTTAS
jgi:hypothetical protein